VFGCTALTQLCPPAASRALQARVSSAQHSTQLPDPSGLTAPADAQGVWLYSALAASLSGLTASPDWQGGSVRRAHAAAAPQRPQPARSVVLVRRSRSCRPSANPSQPADIRSRCDRLGAFPDGQPRGVQTLTVTGVQRTRAAVHQHCDFLQTLSV
jgi:hypothetical protein